MFSFFKKWKDRQAAAVVEGPSQTMESNRPPMHLLSPHFAPTQIASNRRPRSNYRQLVPERVQKLIAGLLIWAFLAAWSVSAFWEHIDTLEPADKWMAKFGACGAEVILLFFILWDDENDSHKIHHKCFKRLRHIELATNTSSSEKFR